MHIFYPIIIVLGFFTSYTDIKSQKIRNKHLFWGALFGLCIYAHLIITQNITPTIDLGSNLLLGIGLGLLLYFTDTWGAGDAKLFAVFCLLMPTEKYSHIFPFASIAIFVNVFVLSTLALLIVSINQLVKSEAQIFKMFFSLETFKRLKNSLFIILSLSWMFTPILSFLIPKVTMFLFMLIHYCFYSLIYSVLNKYPRNHSARGLILVSGLIARFYFQPEFFARASILPNIKITLYYTLSFHYLRSIITSENKNNKNMPFAPIIFLGTILANTEFLNSVLHILRVLRR